MHAHLSVTLVLWVVLAFSSRAACTNAPPQVALGRIIHGWTNYSTGFNATHDSAPQGDYSTVASFFTPASNVVPQEYAVIVVWLGDQRQTADFTRFTFSVSFWSDLAAFTNHPRAGDVACLLFPEPTGGSTITPDAYTRRGRPAYELRFSLSNAPMLAQGQPYLVGFAAHTDPASSGELFVPTSSHPGPSDVQGGSLVTGGWRYVVDAGGSTIYDGQLATELWVQPVEPRPALLVRRQANAIHLSWSSPSGCYTLEAADELGAAAHWLPVAESPQATNDLFTLALPTTNTARFFRLAK